MSESTAASGNSLALYSTCAVKTGGSNPCHKQEKPGEMLLGQPSYLMAKAYGTRA